MHLLAMTGCSCKWMLPLLLLLFIRFHHSSPAVIDSNRAHSWSTFNRHEFDMEVGKLGNSVKNCTNSSCSSLITEEKCQCFNTSLPQEKCGFLQYYTHGLKSLHDSISSKPFIKHLIQRLRVIDNILKCSESCGAESCPNSKLCYIPCKAILSPHGLYNGLKDMMEKINSINHQSGV